MTENNEKILSIDIGGTHVKASVLSMGGELMVDYTKLPTPQPATPDAIVNTIKELTKNFPPYDKISVGFPGYVKDNIVLTAPNLAPDSWSKIDLAAMLASAMGKPAKVVNDADLQGLGIVSGQGIEMMITLGTGFGTAFLKDGVLLPHMELAHHPIRKKKTYDEYIGEKARLDKGDEKWNKRMEKVLAVIKTVFNYDRLYLGGGNAKRITFKLDDNIQVVTNKDAIDGGIKLWKE